jgi:hypothetical protein
VGFQACIPQQSHHVTVRHQPWVADRGSTQALPHRQSKSLRHGVSEQSGIASQCYPAANTASALHTAGAQQLAPSQAVVANSGDARTHTVIRKGHAAATLHTTGSIYVPRQGNCRYTAGLLTWRHACRWGPGACSPNLQLPSTHPAVQLNAEFAYYVQSVPHTSTTEPNPAHKTQCDHTQRYTTSRYKPTHDHTILPSHPAPLAPPSTCLRYPKHTLPCLPLLSAALS